jgi:aspartate aminotransferase-like enzyme
MRKRYLLAPGPTPVAPEILLAMARPILHHRSADFEKIMAEVSENLKWLFQTRQDVILLSSTGTGGMESAVSNFLSPGDRAVVVNGGKFGERWLKICQAFGVEVDEIKVEWGTAVDPRAVADRLKKNPSAKAVLVQASESSTGVAHDVKALGEITRTMENTVLIVDAVSAMGVFDLQTDNWGLDVVVTGSQKALMLPPGLAFVSVSEKAWRMNEKAKNAKFYFNLKKERDSQRKKQTAFTASVSLVVGLHEVLKSLKDEGLEKIFARHELLADATRRAMVAAGLSLFPKESPSNALTAVNAPTGTDGQAIYRTLREKYGITAAGGQDHLKGKIFRLAHMGYMDLFDVIIGVSAVEMVLKDLGYPVRMGEGVRAAEEILSQKW